MTTKPLTIAQTLGRKSTRDHGRGRLPASGTALSSRQQDFGLSPRENEVLQLMANGLADKEIALAIGVSRFTVNKHVSAIIGKLAAKSKTEAAVRGIRAGLIS